MKKIIGILLCLCPMVTFSADWVEIYQNETGKGFVERENITSTNGVLRTYWRRHDPKEPKQTPKGIEKRIVSREMINCQTKQQAILSVFYYSPENQLIRKSEFNKNMVRFEPIAKGSLGEDIAQFVCAQRLKK